jgi:hypothetical protein
MPLYNLLLSAKEFRYSHRNIVVPLYTSTTRPKRVERLQSSTTHGARNKGCIPKQFGRPNSSRYACERVGIRVPVLPSLVVSRSSRAFRVPQQLLPECNFDW